jgi:hypothetical protein
MRTIRAPRRRLAAEHILPIGLTIAGMLLPALRFAPPAAAQHIQRPSG